MICSILLLLVSVIRVLWNCNFMLTLNKYVLHSNDFHFSALTLLARFFRQNTVKALQACERWFASEKQQFKELQNGLTA